MLREQREHGAGEMIRIVEVGQAVDEPHGPVEGGQWHEHRLVPSARGGHAQGAYRRWPRRPVRSRPATRSAVLEYAREQEQAMPDVDHDKLMEFVHKVIGDWGAVASAPLVVIGDKLGLYRAMADGEPVTSTELAERTGTTERYVREWLGSQAAGGYVTLDDDGRYRLEPEQAVALTDESSPACVIGGFEAFTAAAEIGPRLAEAFRDGSGIGWDEHPPGLFRGTARFFRPGYAASLTSEWLPALDGVDTKLRLRGPGRGRRMRLRRTPRC